MKIPSTKKREMFFALLKIRRVEETIARLYPQQEMRCPVHLCMGQEAIPAGVCQALEPGDSIFCSHRSHGYYIARGGPLTLFMAELYGKASGYDGGKSGSQHLIAPEIGLTGSSAIVAGTIPIAAGAALAFRMQGSKSVAVADFGDGAVDEGVFYESLNFSALHRLPVVFICENNRYATHSHQSERQAREDLCAKASSFGVPAVSVDGNDALAVYAAAVKAVKRARAGKGPGLVECITYRWLEHAGPGFDHSLGYRSEKELQRWMRDCPLKKLTQALLKRGLVSSKEMLLKERQISRRIEEAVAFARRSRAPGRQELLKHVY